MKIKVIKQTIKANDIVEWDMISYKIQSIEKCCDDVVNNPIIELSEQYGINQNEELYGVFLVHKYTSHIPYEDDDYNEIDWYKIDYCPFCGERIEIEIVEDIDISEEYYGLVFERDEIQKIINNCDSIKQKCELENNRRELDRKIESFYNSEGFEIIKNEDEI